MFAGTLTTTGAVVVAATATSADIAAKLAEYNIPELESQLATAQQRRTDLLLTGTDDEILAAESEATKARLALDRGNAAIVELNRRLEEARAEERKAALDAEYAATRAKVDVAVERIKSEYPALAAKIVELCELADEADEAAASWSKRSIAGETEGLPVVDTVTERLELHNKWMVYGITFESATRLLPVEDFEGYGVDFETVALHHARYGLSVPQVPSHQCV